MVSLGNGVWLSFFSFFSCRQPTTYFNNPQFLLPQISFIPPEVGKQQGSLGSNGGGGKLQALAMVGIILNILTNQTSPVRRLWKGSFFPNSEFSVVWGLRCKLLSVIKVCPSWGDWNLMQMLLRSCCRELPHSFGFYKMEFTKNYRYLRIEVLAHTSPIVSMYGILQVYVPTFSWFWWQM